ncbi:MAG: hypothetical protein ACREBR_04250 [bacterium]
MKSATYQNLRVTASAFRSGTGNVSTAFSSIHGWYQWDAQCLSEKLSKEYTVDVDDMLLPHAFQRMSYVDCKDTNYEEYADLLECIESVTPLTLTQGSADWHLCRKFSLTSSTVHRALGIGTKLFGEREHWRRVNAYLSIETGRMSLETRTDNNEQNESAGSSETETPMLNVNLDGDDLRVGLAPETSGAAASIEIDGTNADSGSGSNSCSSSADESFYLALSNLRATIGANHSDVPVDVGVQTTPPESVNNDPRSLNSNSDVSVDVEIQTTTGSGNADPASLDSSNDLSDDGQSASISHRLAQRIAKLDYLAVSNGDETNDQTVTDKLGNVHLDYLTSFLQAAGAKVPKHREGAKKKVEKWLDSPARERPYIFKSKAELVVLLQQHSGGSNQYSGWNAARLISKVIEVTSTMTNHDVH